MRTTILLSAIVLLSYASLAQEIDNILTPEEFTEGWELLFDGHSLKGWKAFNGDDPKTWDVDQNSLHCKGEKGGDDIMTVDMFGDFDFKFEWKIQENGNSGVIYKVREGKQWKKPYLTGPEYQVYGESGKYDNKSTGSLYDVYATSELKKVNPAMEWNSGRIRISNGMLSHWVNGVVVVQCQLYSDDWNQKVAESKWKNNQFFGKSPFGHIDFQNHGSEVWYKNIKIKRLD